MNAVNISFKRGCDLPFNSPMWRVDTESLWVVATTLNLRVLMYLCGDARTWTKFNHPS